MRNRILYQKMRYLPCLTSNYDPKGKNINDERVPHSHLTVTEDYEQDQIPVVPM